MVSLTLVLLWNGFYFPSLIGLEYCFKVFEIGVYLFLGEIAVRTLFLLDVNGLFCGLFVCVVVMGRVLVFNLCCGLVNFFGVFFTLNTFCFYSAIVWCYIFFLVGLAKVIILFLLVEWAVFPMTLLFDPTDD